MSKSEAPMADGVKRYDLDRGEGYMAYATMEESPHGEYVLADDYAKLSAERDAVVAALELAQADVHCVAFSAHRRGEPCGDLLGIANRMRDAIRGIYTKGLQP